MDVNRLAVSLRPIVDLVSLTVLLIPSIVLRSAVKPVRRGFFCDDETIRYPFKENTVPPLHLAIIVIAFPILVIAVIEKVRLRSINKSTDSENGKKYWSELYKQIKYYLLGFAVSLTITMFSKYATGRLRPNFIAVCRPNIDCAMNEYKYLIDFKCNNTDVETVEEARQAFMSGHASTVCFAMIYLIIAIELRINWTHFRTMKLVSQMMLLLIAMYVSISRVTDHWHHWQDVCVGGAQGAAIAVFTVLFISDYRRGN